MNGKSRISVPGIWIILTFVLIAVTLASMLFMVYSYISREELRQTLNEQVSVLSDNADNRILRVMENQYLTRLASREDAAALIAALSGGNQPETSDIRALMQVINEVKAAFPVIDRVDIYFPGHAIVVGSAGVRFINDKKYEVRGTPFDDILGEYPSDSKWLRRVLPMEGEQTAFISYLRMVSGVFTSQQPPMLMVTIPESRLHEQLRAMLRTIRPADRILLCDNNGVIFSAEDATLIGTTLPVADSSTSPLRLANGQAAHIAEMISDTGAWHYVLARAQNGNEGYGGMLSLWIALSVGLLIVGLVLVLRVLFKHYARPMQHLMKRLDLPEKTDSGRLLSSPARHFMQIESALSDMDALRSEREAFIRQSRPVLRQFWLNSFIRGEAHYTQPQAQLDINFPHPHFQVAILSRRPSDEEIACIDSVFDGKNWTNAVFETANAQTVLLTNHGQNEAALPRLLNLAGERLPESGQELFFGVGILAVTEDMTAASFRCARRVMSERYFVKEQRVYVFDPNVPHRDADNVIAAFSARLTALLGNLPDKPLSAIKGDVRSMVAELREMNPYLDTMRKVMLMTAAAFSKPAFDAQVSPESLYGDNLMDAYYHIADINAFGARLLADTEKLQGFLSRRDNDGNRPVIQYAIHHIRSAPPADLSTQSIADALSISTGYLSRLFRQETGRKLVDFLQDVRMEHAARLLAEGRLSNEEICEAVGYSRLQYLSAKFKERYGLTLNEYRNKVRYKPAPRAEGTD